MPTDAERLGGQGTLTSPVVWRRTCPGCGDTTIVKFEGVDYDVEPPTDLVCSCGRRFNLP